MLPKHHESYAGDPPDMKKLIITVTILTLGCDYFMDMGQEGYQERRTQMGGDLKPRFLTPREGREACERASEEPPRRPIARTGENRFDWDAYRQHQDDMKLCARFQREQARKEANDELPPLLRQW